MRAQAVNFRQAGNMVNGSGVLDFTRQFSGSAKKSRLPCYYHYSPDFRLINNQFNEMKDIELI